MISDALAFLQERGFWIFCLLAAFWAWLRFGHRNYLERYFRLVCGRAGNLTQRDFYGGTFKGLVYSPRTTDSALASKIAAGRHLLVTGPRLSGKSRSIYEILRRHEQRACIWVMRPDFPQSDSGEPTAVGTFAVPGLNIRQQVRVAKALRPCFRRRHLVVIDGIGGCVKREGFFTLLEALTQLGFQVIATCPSGESLSGLRDAMSECPPRFADVFGEDGIVQVGKISQVTAKVAAEANSIRWSAATGRFDGTIGSLFLNLDAMKSRSDQLDTPARKVLLLLRQLDVSGLLFDSSNVPLKSLRDAGRRVIGLSDTDLTEGLEELKSAEFLEIYQERVRVERVYLRFADDTTSTRGIVERMMKAFSDDEKALAMIGDQCRRGHNPDLDVLTADLGLRCFQESFRLRETLSKRLKIGQTYGIMREYDVAIRVAEEVLADRGATDWVRSLAWSHRGVYLEKKFLTNQATVSRSAIVRSFRRSLELTPSLVQALYGLGGFLARPEVGRFRMAERCFARALTLDGDNARTMIGRLNALKRLERFEEALDQLDDIEKVEALSDEIIYSKAWPNCERAELLKDLGRYEKARASASAAVKRDGKDVGAWNTLVYMDLLTRDRLNEEGLRAIQAIVRDALESLEKGDHFRFRSRVLTSGLAWFGRQVVAGTVRNRTELTQQVALWNSLPESVRGSGLTVPAIRERLKERYPDFDGSALF